MPKINPEIMVWARKTAGLSAADAAKKLSIGPAKGMKPEDRLISLESGAEQPSRPLLVKMSKQYRRSLLTFYQSRPPLKGDRGEDFRTLPEDYSRTDEALLDSLIRNIRARQNIVRSALEDDEDVAPLHFIDSMNMSDGVEKVLKSITETLNLQYQVLQAQSSVGDVFKVIRDATEAAGIFVLLMGNLGSHHTTIEPEVFRGFAIADKLAPFVVINDQDAKSAWSFTLLHELTHLWLGQTGVSTAFSERAVEKFCNSVASEFLLPTYELEYLSISDQMEVASSVEQISDFANERNISRPMVAYKLYQLGAIGFDYWNELAAHFRAQWLQHKKLEKESARSGEGGPNYYVVRRHRVGNALINLVNRLNAAGTLTTTKAAMVLEVKPHNLQALTGNSSRLAGDRAT